MSDVDPAGPVSPSDSGGFDVPDQQGWPKPVGIIGLVLGCMNVFCGGLGMLALAMPVIFAAQVQQEFPDGLPPYMTAFPMSMLAMFGISVLVQALLVTAAATLLMRKGIARPLHLAYAVIGLLFFAINTYVSVQFQVELTEWVKQNPDTKFAQQQTAGGWIGQAIGWTFGITLGLIWPVFCGVWFGFLKKESDITQGRQEVM